MIPIIDSIIKYIRKKKEEHKKWQKWAKQQEKELLGLSDFEYCKKIFSMNNKQLSYLSQIDSLVEKTIMVRARMDKNKKGKKQ